MTKNNMTIVISKTSALFIALALLISAAFIASVYAQSIQVTATVSATVRIIAFGISVTPTSIDYGDLVFEVTDSVDAIVTISNTGNVPLTVTFSDDLGGDSLTMTYPAAFELAAGASIDVTLTLNYVEGSGWAAAGQYTWTITITGTEAL